jgi:hypothetical protein
MAVYQRGEIRIQKHLTLPPVVAPVMPVAPPDVPSDPLTLQTGRT